MSLGYSMVDEPSNESPDAICVFTLTSLDVMKLRGLAGLLKSGDAQIRSMSCTWLSSADSACPLNFGAALGLVAANAVADDVAGAPWLMAGVGDCCVMSRPDAANAVADDVVDDVAGAVVDGRCVARPPNAAIIFLSANCANTLFVW